MLKITRRELIKKLSAAAGALLTTKAAWLLGMPETAHAAAMHDIYVSRNLSPVSNVTTAISLAGGIQHFIDYDDVVVLKPNGQWKQQGYTNTESMMALIDTILARPGGFAGEIIIAEHVHRNPGTGTNQALSGEFCWNMSVGSNRLYNYANMSYMELVNSYHNHSVNIVTADPLYESGVGTFVKVDGPSHLTGSQQGWVHSLYTTTSNGKKVTLSYPILRSGYSGKLIDVKNGVWQNGSYTGQKVKLIFLPTLNNHGGPHAEDYAGATSAVKCHIGFQDFNNLDSGAENLHNIGYGSPVVPAAMGESVGQLISQLIHPTFYLTCAEYSGHQSRYDSVPTHTKTVALCTDPVTLDYWMCKNILYPCDTAQNFLNPANNNNLRKTLVGCNSKGVGTLNEAEITVHKSTVDLPYKTYLPSTRKAK
jgi:hypothetical protein